MLLHDRRDAAWQVVRRLHHSQDDPNRIFAKEEFYQMEAQMAQGKPLIETEGFLDLFKQPSYRKRLFVGALTTFAAESTGILVVYSMAPMRPPY